MAARFRIDQATPGAGVPDRSRLDLVDGEVLSLVVTDAAPGATYAWTILDRVGSTAALTSPTGTTTTIGPSGDILEPCAFAVKCTETLGGTSRSTTLVAAIPGPVPTPQLRETIGQAELFYQILAMIGVVVGDSTEFSDADPEDIGDATDPGDTEEASRSNHQHREPRRFIKQGLDVAQADTTPVLVTSIYLEAGTLKAPARVLIGTDDGDATATLYLRALGSATVLATWAATGILQDASQGADIPLGAGWHQLTLVCSSVDSRALLAGMDWLYIED